MKSKSCAGCNRESKIWKRVDGKGYCQSCSKSLSAKKQSIKQPLAQRSAKKVKLDDQYSKLRRQFLLEHPVCQAHLPGCSQVSTDVHHTQGRGKNYLRVETWVSLCRACHKTIEENPDLGRDIDMVQHRW